MRYLNKPKCDEVDDEIDGPARKDDALAPATNRTLIPNRLSMGREIQVPEEISRLEYPEYASDHEEAYDEIRS